jgi:small subunit ribosomal protein S1
MTDEDKAAPEEVPEMNPDTAEEAPAGDSFAPEATAEEAPAGDSFAPEATAEEAPAGDSFAPEATAEGEELEDAPWAAPEAPAEESFAELLAKSYTEQVDLKPGQKIKATVQSVTADWVFLNAGRKGEGVVDKKEFVDAEGAVSIQEGDTVTAFFVSSSDDGLVFTTKVKGGAAGNAVIEEAHRSGTTIEGQVSKEIKGGFEVKVADGVRAFCPFSQMALRRVENPAEYVGQRLPFRITELRDRGKNIVLSHRVLLEEERRKDKDAARERLVEGSTLTGRITSLRDFGAFVDLGGIEGLLPISEVGWSRVKDIKEVLQAGQDVTVLVKQIDRERNRITLSLKDTLPDPWLQAAERFIPGSTHTGTVVRLTQFGAFISLDKGLDGLVHISKLGGGKRIKHPREVVKEGEPIEVTVESVDRDKKRISLTPVNIQQVEDETKNVEEYRRSSRPPGPPRPSGSSHPADSSRESSRAPASFSDTGNVSMGTLGDIMRARLAEKEKKD